MGRVVTVMLRPDQPLSIEDVVMVARLGARVALHRDSVAAMKRSRAVVESALGDGRAHYGINTGFGSLSKQRISSSDLATLQRNLVRSHAAGVGPPLPSEVVRGMLLLLAASLGRGLSGVRPELAKTIVDVLNAGILPVVPEVGSVGASGDLAPLAHIALVLTGEGRAVIGGREMAGGKALASAGIRPISLGAKEGLALINGTHLMAARGALLCFDAERLLRAAWAGLAMSIDACRATDSFLDERLYEARAHWGAQTTAAAVRALLAGSEIVKSHRKNDPRVQDPYSLRAAPTVLGAVDLALTHIDVCIGQELGAVTDNPLVFAEGAKSAIVSGANFHGLPVALPLDYLAIAISHLAGISERRTYLMTGAFEPESHLKPFLAPRPGLQSGLMIAQYTAAACVNEIVGLTMPASPVNIPTSAGMEDYNSFGPRSAAKAARCVDLARRVVAIEMMCAAEGLEHHRPLKSGKGVERALSRVRSVVPKLKDDRELTGDIEGIAGLIAAGAFDDLSE